MPSKRPSRSAITFYAVFFSDIPSRHPVTFDYPVIPIVCLAILRKSKNHYYFLTPTTVQQLSGPMRVGRGDRHSQVLEKRVGLLGPFKSFRPVGEPCKSGTNLTNQALAQHTKVRRTGLLGIR
jgi:hypothetical protein